MADALAPEQNEIADLFVRGAELTIKDEETGKQVTVWLQKLNPVEQQTAARRANAARAKYLAAQYDETSDEYLDIFNYVADLSRDECVEALLGVERLKLYELKAAELELEKPWKDGYIEGLRSAWNNGLEDTFAQDPEDKEAKRVRGQLIKFRDEVQKRAEDELEMYRMAHKEKSDKVLRQDVVEMVFKSIANDIWNEEFQRCRIWLGTRSVRDHSKPIFAAREAVNVLQDETLALLLEGFRKLTVPPQEGKDSPAPPASSS